MMMMMVMMMMVMMVVVLMVMMMMTMIVMMMVTIKMMMLLYGLKRNCLSYGEKVIKRAQDGVEGEEDLETEVLAEAPALVF